MDKNIFNNFPKNKFPRDNQIKLMQQISDALETGKKFIVINAPTGTGKSFIAAAIANSSEESPSDWVEFVRDYQIWNPLDGQDKAARFPNTGAAVLTVTKNLQDQYTKDFDNLHLFKGKSNYICNYDNNFDIDTAPCNSIKSLKKECWACKRCSYYEDRNKSLVNKFAVYNYDVWMNIPEYARKKEVIICDEASELEGVIVSHFSLELQYEDLCKALDLTDYPELKSEENEPARDWLMKLYEFVKETLAEYEEILKDKLHPDYKKASTKRKFVERYFSNIERVLNNWGINGESKNSVEYVVELIEPDKYNKKIKKGVTFTPLRVNKLANHLFKTADHVILLSATIIDHQKEMSDLGISRDQYVYIEAPNSFDPKKSPIYISEKYPLTYKELNQNLPKVIELVEKIIDKHEDEKGLIHTVSFKITQEVSNRIINNRLIFREAGKTNEMMLKEHSESDQPTVMVSPSMSHGVDLKGDLGRFQIIMKTPYLPLSSKRIKILSKQDYAWYANKALSTIVQMAGRCTRNETDESVTYILDASVGNLLRRNWIKLPKFFRDRIG